MSQFDGLNICILDLETLNSADEIEDGWRNKVGLGLSIGAWYDYRDGRMHFFDRDSLLTTMQYFVGRQPLMVSFNGLTFDFALMRALLRNVSDANIDSVCDEFKDLCVRGYDILHEVWRADSENRFAPGLNSLDAICKACGLGEKSGTGTQAPLDWRAGRYAKVINYCSDDVYLTKALFEYVTLRGGEIKRSSGPLQIANVLDMESYHELACAQNRPVA